MANKRYVHLGKSVFDAARERLRSIADRYDTILVSFSGGKDSTVCLHLALDELPAARLRVVHFDEECVSPDTEAYVDQVRKMVGPERFDWLCVPIKHRNACSRTETFWYPWAEADREKWVRPMPDGVVTQHDIPGFAGGSIPEIVGQMYPASEYGRVGCIVGIRANESMTRRMMIVNAQRTYGEPHVLRSVQHAHIQTICPIYDWTNEDVWFAPDAFGWPYNASYDKMAKAGISLHMQRVAPPFGEQPAQLLWMWHVCWPEMWDRMCDRVPGAATAKRYSRTSLYGFGSQEKTGATWQETIRQVMAQMKPGDRKTIAQSIVILMHEHSKFTSDEIPDETPHPTSGFSWKLIAIVAQRGDLKGGRLTMNVKSKAYGNRVKVLTAAADRLRRVD